DDRALQVRAHQRVAVDLLEQATQHRLRRPDLKLRDPVAGGGRHDEHRRRVPVRHDPVPHQRLQPLPDPIARILHPADRPLATAPPPPLMGGRPGRPPPAAVPAVLYAHPKSSTPSSAATNPSRAPAPATSIRHSSTSASSSLSERSGSW